MRIIVTILLLASLAAKSQSADTTCLPKREGRAFARYSAPFYERHGVNLASYPWDVPAANCRLNLAERDLRTGRGCGIGGGIALGIGAALLSVGGTFLGSERPHGGAENAGLRRGLYWIAAGLAGASVAVPLLVVGRNRARRAAKHISLIKDL